jgi:hypothetical protein
MSMWLLIVGATAFGGALIVWNIVSRTKHVTENLLDQYQKMLTDARAQKLEKLEEEREAATAIPTTTAVDEVSQVEPVANGVTVPEPDELAELNARMAGGASEDDDAR